MAMQLTDLNEQILVSIYLRRDLHENGMTLKEYADAVTAGTQPVLDHDAFVYQFGSVAEEVALVESWAVANGLTIYESSSAMAVVKVHGTAEQFNRLFNIELQTVIEDDRTYTTHSTAISIPLEINDVVENVLGLDNSVVFKRNLVEYNPALNPNPTALDAVTPVQVATAYNVPAGNGYGGCIGIFELTYSGYITGYNASDVNQSFSRIGLTAPTIVNVSVDGATISSTSDGESMLDIYCAGAVAPKAKIAYYDAPNSYQGVVDCILATANDTTNNPSVLSISWALGDSTYYDASVQACVVKGITVLQATGDAGAQNLNMASPYGIGTNPAVIMCGGTTIELDGNNQIVNETAWSGSGGGISTGAFARPSWQNGLIYQTITSGGVIGSPTALPYRGVPDISAPADPTTGYQFYVNNVFVQYGGTSAAAPFLAGMIVRLNVLLGSRIGNQPSTWYTNSSTLFRDTVSGDNRDGYATGYNTTSGWDAVTGLGSPKSDQVYKLLKKGLTYPKSNFGFRRSGTLNYPRITRPTS